MKNNKIIKIIKKKEVARNDLKAISHYNKKALQVKLCRHFLNKSLLQFKSSFLSSELKPLFIYIFLVAYAQIDWHDFVVVETVDYQPFEIGNFPPPTTPEEVGARILIQERLEDGEDIEMQLESDEEEAAPHVRCAKSLNF